MPTTVELENRALVVNTLQDLISETENSDIFEDLSTSLKDPNRGNLVMLLGSLVSAYRYGGSIEGREWTSAIAYFAAIAIRDTVEEEKEWDEDEALEAKLASEAQTQELAEVA